MYVSNVIDELTSDLDGRIDEVQNHLETSLAMSNSLRNWKLHFDFDPSEIGKRPTELHPPAFSGDSHLGFWRRTFWAFHSASAKQSARDGNSAYLSAKSEHEKRWDVAVNARATEIAAFDTAYKQRLAEVHEANEQVAELERLFLAGDREARWFLFGRKFARFIYRIDPIPGDHQITYSAESKRVVVEFDLPTKTVVPMERSVKFLKTTGEHRYSYRTDADMRRMYSSFVAQAVLGIVNAAFVLSDESLVETVAVNGVVEAPDAATGIMTRIPIISVVTSRGLFENINLADVDPIACLRHLSATVSRSPAEVVPIRPIVRLDMSDPRFVSDSDVLELLDTRPNLMELSPNEFESLVQNLFSKMGLDTKQTRPSRDGGVDAIAYNPRPILGGKIVIQAKRYKNTVGVSAVRDLFGTLQNEGGSKGILVTTSGYGSASFEFAKNKPLELIDGSNLLYLLKEHAGIDAKIVMPDDWVDPLPDY